MTPADRPLLLYLISDQLSSIFLRGQLAHMLEEDYRVVVATRCDRAGAAAAFDEGVEVAHLAYVREPKPVADLRALYATVRLIRRKKPRLVNSSTPKAGLLGTVAAWLCRVPVRVYVVRGFRFETATGWRRRLYRTAEWVTMRCANHILFNSPSLRALAEKERLVRPGTGEVLGAGSSNGVDTQRFSALPDRREARRSFGLSENDEVIGFVGRLTRDKGAGDLVTAFLDLRVVRPAARLLLVGAQEDGDPLDATTRAVIHQDPSIIAVDWCEDTSVAYRAMDLLGFPSYREGMPNVALEAQLCGVPVVGYAATGTVDAVRHGMTGVLVPIGDHRALASEMATLLNDATRRQELGEQAERWVCSSFSQQAIWLDLSDRYRTWLSRSGSS